MIEYQTIHNEAARIKLLNQMNAIDAMRLEEDRKFWAVLISSSVFHKMNCNCCNQEIKENAIEDKWNAGFICKTCQDEENTEL